MAVKWAGVVVALVGFSVVLVVLAVHQSPPTPTTSTTSMSTAVLPTSTSATHSATAIPRASPSKTPAPTPVRTRSASRSQPPPGPTRAPLGLRRHDQVAPSELAKRPWVQKHKFVFAASTGYSGTKTLAQLLNTAPDVTCFHERAPALVEFPNILREGRNATYKARADVKLAAIAKDLETVPELAASPHQVYCDTSHMFVKSWADVFLDKAQAEGHEVHVVVLRRYLPHVLRSSIKDGAKAWVPSRPLHHYSGGEYLLHHRNFAILHPVFSTPETTDSVDLALGYFMDMEAQINRLKAKYPFVQFHEIRTEALDYVPSVRALFGELGIQFADTTLKAIQQKGGSSKNRHATKALKAAIPEEAYLFRILNYLEMRRGQGLPVPPLPHLLPFKITASGDALALPPPLIGAAELEAMRVKYQPVFDNLTTVARPVLPVHFLSATATATHTPSPVPSPLPSHSWAGIVQPSVPVTATPGPKILSPDSPGLKVVAPSQPVSSSTRSSASPSPTALP